MRPNPLRARLLKGEPVFGPFIMEFASPGLPCILTNAGADFIVYDQEAGCLVATPDAARQWIAIGYRFVGFGTDVQLLASAFRDAMAVIKAWGGASQTAPTQ